MKKIMIAVLALFIMLPALAFAQKDYAIDKGVILVDGMASYTSAGGDLRGEERATTVYLDPSIGYFIMPHLAIGVNFGFWKMSQGDYSDSIFEIGPSVAYFLGDASSKVYPFVAGTFLYRSDDDEYTETDIKFEGGAAFMVAKNVAISGSAFYMMESRTPEDADDSVGGNTFGVEFGIGIFIY
jgi:hypothetical protein